MPVSSLINVPYQTVTRIAEVNPRRETLTIINMNPMILALADDDQPRIIDHILHGIPIFPYSFLTLERKDGDQPDRAWYVFCPSTIDIVVFEGMTPPGRRWW